MALEVYELTEGGVVIIDRVTELPVAIARCEFESADDAEKFLAWSEGLRGLKRHDAIELEHAVERWRAAGEPEGDER